MTDAQILDAALAAHNQAVSSALFPEIRQVSQFINHQLRSGHGPLLVAGNGGSSSDAAHFVGELVGRFRDERRPWPAINLGADGPTLTCLGNDYGYEEVFARQVSGYASLDPMLMVISTSGRSENLIRAARTARALDIPVVGLLGRDGGPLLDLCDLSIVVRSQLTSACQEAHIFCIHAICELLDHETLRTPGW